MKRRLMSLLGISVCILFLVGTSGCSGTVGYYYGPPIYFTPPQFYFPAPVIVPFNPVWCW